MWILALDVGTSSIRAIGYDALGRPLPGADARVGCEPSTTPDGGSELDPEELVAATASAIDGCLAAVPGPPTAARSPRHHLGGHSERSRRGAVARAA